MPNINIDIVYMNIAKEIAKLSYAKRAKVGAILVKNNSIIAYGYNGMPSEFQNICETEVNGELITNREVLHAETNCISKIAKSTYSSEGSDMYVTMSVCYDCAKLIIQSGIKRVFYSEEYRDKSGLELLKKAKIEIIQI